MYKPLGLLFMWCESEFYPGGEREAGVIDLPVQRNPLTQLPAVNSSAIKGALRSSVEIGKIGNMDANFIFGNQFRSGALEFLNANLLLFPVHSYIGTFAYVASPEQFLTNWLMYLEERNPEQAKEMYELVKKILGNVEKGKVVITENSIFKGSDLFLLRGEFIAESSNFIPLKESGTILSKLLKMAIPRSGNKVWTGYNYLKNKILRNTVFVNYESFRSLVEKGLVRVARIAIDYETKIVKQGALFYQELIPQYSLLCTAIFRTARYEGNDELKASINTFVNDYLRRNPLINLGGDETTGKGMVRLVFSEGEK